ncbi:flavodoxin [Brucella lupini]|uniref:Flavodoxin n=2 Tax=Brucella lupini TaxID=255457 RepID=A0AB34DIT2_9HYPH|nr:flavodoxin [Brucella lupini]
MVLNNLTRREILMTSLLMAGGAAAVSSAAAAQLPQGKILVAYFSRSGNTRVVAGQVRRAIGADLFEIMPRDPYPDDYFETVEQAQQETERGFEPPLKESVADIGAYATVFLGFPIWGTTAPPLLRSFLSAHDLSGKTLIPLVTHGGYGLGNSLSVVADRAKGAHLVEGFSMEAPQERQTIEQVTEWLNALDTRK